MCEFWSIIAQGCRFWGLSTAGCAHLGQHAEPTPCCTPIPEPGCCRAVPNTWGAATAKGRQRHRWHHRARSEHPSQYLHGNQLLATCAAAPRRHGQFCSGHGHETQKSVKHQGKVSGKENPAAKWPHQHAKQRHGDAACSRGVHGVHSQVSAQRPLFLATSLRLFFKGDRDTEGKSLSAFLMLRFPSSPLTARVSSHKVLTCTKTPRKSLKLQMRDGRTGDYEF